MDIFLATLLGAIIAMPIFRPREYEWIVIGGKWVKTTSEKTYPPKVLVRQTDRNPTFLESKLWSSR